MDGDTGTEVRRVVIDDRPVAAMGEWVSIRERLPDAGKKVLIWHPAFSEHRIVYFNPVLGQFEDWSKGACVYIQAQHWISLPEPPAETEV